MVNQPETQLIMLVLRKESSEACPTAKAAGKGKHAGHLFFRLNQPTVDANSKDAKMQEIKISFS